MTNSFALARLRQVDFLFTERNKMIELTHSFLATGIKRKISSAAGGHLQDGFVGTER